MRACVECARRNATPTVVVVNGSQPDGRPAMYYVMPQTAQSAPTPYLKQQQQQQQQQQAYPPPLQSGHDRTLGHFDRALPPEMCSDQAPPTKAELDSSPQIDATPVDSETHDDRKYQLPYHLVSPDPPAGRE